MSASFELLNRNNGEFRDQNYRSYVSNIDSLWFESFLPDSLHAVAEVIEDMASGNAAACGQETTDDAADVAADEAKAAETQAAKQKWEPLK